MLTFFWLIAFDYPEWAFGNFRKPNAIALFVIIFLFSPINAFVTVCFCATIGSGRWGLHRPLDPSKATCFVFFSILCTIFALIWPVCLYVYSQSFP